VGGVEVEVKVKVEENLVLDFVREEQFIAISLNWVECGKLIR